MKRRLSLLALIVTAIALVLVVAGPTLAQSAGSMFDYVIARKLLVRGTTALVGAVTTSGDVVVGDDLTVTDDAAVSGDLDVTGALEVTGGVTGDLTGDVTATAIGLTGDLDVTGLVTVTGDVDLTGTLEVTGPVTVTGNTLLDGVVVAGGTLGTNTYFGMAAQTAISVTADAIITPTGSFQPLDSAADVGTDAIAITPNSGAMLYLLNVGSYTITLTDTGVLNLSGNLVLTPGDAASLIIYDEEWYQLSGETN